MTVVHTFCIILLIFAVAILSSRPPAPNNCAPMMASDDHAGYAHFTAADGQLYEFPLACKR